MPTGRQWVQATLVTRRLHACSLRIARAGSLIAALILLTGFTAFTSPRVSARASHRFAQQKKVCAIHQVRVSPDKPASVTCEKYTLAVNGVVPYSVDEDRCNFVGIGDALMIVSHSRGVYCFMGAGYVGLGDGAIPSGDIYDATEIESLCNGYYNGYYDTGGCMSYGSGWVRYYAPSTSPTGHTFYFGGGGAFDSSNSVFSKTTKVTQVYLDQ